MLSCCQIHDKENYLRSPLLLTAAAALPPEFLQQSEHQIEAMGHVEPGQPKTNPTYPTNLFNLLTSCFCKGKMEENKFLRTHWWMRRFQDLCQISCPEKHLGLYYLYWLAQVAVASNASKVIPDTACSWTFCPQSWEALTILGRRLSKSCLLERKVWNKKWNNQDFDIQLESNMNKRFNYKSYLFFLTFPKQISALFDADAMFLLVMGLVWCGWGMKLRMG